LALKVSFAQCGFFGLISLGIAAYDCYSGMFFSLGVLIAVLPHNWQMHKLEKAGYLVSSELLRNTEIIKFLVTAILFLSVFWIFAVVSLVWLFAGVVLGYLSWLGLLHQRFFLGQARGPESGK
jgi:F0F1-type ATP synthase assembly protein I